MVNGRRTTQSNDIEVPEYVPQVFLSEKVTHVLMLIDVFLDFPPFSVQSVIDRFTLHEEHSAFCKNATDLLEDFGCFLCGEIMQRR